MEVKNVQRLAKKLTQQHKGTQGKADQESAYHSMHASVYDQVYVTEMHDRGRRSIQQP